MRVRCTITGLECPHCALKLEQQFAGLAGVRSASINLALGRLIMDLDESCSEQDVELLLEHVQHAAAAFQDDLHIARCD